MKADSATEQKIVIVGGGFGGVRTALDLAKRKPSGVKIVLIHDKFHFEYHAALYRVVAGKSPLEVCVPLDEIFHDQDVEVVEDMVTEVNPEHKSLQGKSGSQYQYDVLVLALGSETSYFNIPGLEERSFGFKSIDEALRLKRHIHTVFDECKNGTGDEKICGCDIAIVGGGASGVELAGELAVYTRHLALKHGLDPSFVTIDLIEGMPRILPMLPEVMSKRAEERLRSLGVNIYLNRQVTEETPDALLFKGAEIKTKTVVWTAGVKANTLYGKVAGLELDKRGRVMVDEYFEAKGVRDVFVIGDGAVTTYSGMAQTAVRDGAFLAESLLARINAKHTGSIHQTKYIPKKTAFAIPVGPGWSAFAWGPFKLYGRLGWFMRRAIDFAFFLSILSPREALRAFRQGIILCETCSVCVLDHKNEGMVPTSTETSPASAPA